jgi:hypothetical protein
MTSDMHNHEPTAEFSEFLARDIARTIRHDARFAPSARAIRARRVRLAAVGAGAIVFTLSIGLVWGVGTGYAAARASDGPREESFPVTVLRNMPVRKALNALTCAAAVPAPLAAQTQQGVPVIELPPASVKTAETFGALLGIRQVAGGKVFVNDGRRRQIKLFDSTLTAATIVMDSTPGTSTSYGIYGTALIPYRGDSSLFSHWESQTLLVLDARGQVARVSALPEPNARYSLIDVKSSGAGVDDKGRLVYMNSPLTEMVRGIRDPVTGVSRSRVTQPADSLEILRADLDARRVDTIGRVMQPSGGRLSVVPGTDGGRDLIKRTINPLTAVDEWAVLSDGTIAFVRGHDYHIDWIHPDGTRSSTAKLPFDWKRLTDDDKQKLVDSARTAEVLSATRAALARAAVSGSTGNPDGGAGSGRGSARGGGDVGGPPAGGGRGAMPYDFVPVAEIADYYPAIRRGAAMPDLDGNLWILPTTSAQSKNGELVYDVVNPKAGLFERVRMPAGRSIAGFGKGGVVYLISGDRTNGFYLERTRLPAGSRVPQRK